MMGVYDRIEHPLVRDQPEGTSGEKAPVLSAQRTGYKALRKNQDPLKSKTNYDLLMEQVIRETERTFSLDSGKLFIKLIFRKVLTENHRMFGDGIVHLKLERPRHHRTKQWSRTPKAKKVALQSYEERMDNDGEKVCETVVRLKSLHHRYFFRRLHADKITRG